MRDASFSFETVIAGFAADGAPMLFQGDCVRITEHASPGFVCIGSGSGAATDWLIFRQQHGFLPAQRTYYHVREALGYSELSPTVGQTVNVLLLRHGKPYVDVSRLCPLLENWIKAHYPRLTTDLDKPQAWKDFCEEFGIDAPKPSSSQTSVGPP